MQVLERTTGRIQQDRPRLLRLRGGLMILEEAGWRRGSTHMLLLPSHVHLHRSVSQVWMILGGGRNVHER